MNPKKKMIASFLFLLVFLVPSSLIADEYILKKLLKRKISSKVIAAEKLIKKKKLDRFVSLSVVVNNEVIYCHYEKENRSNLKLIMCY